MIRSMHLLGGRSHNDLQKINFRAYSKMKERKKVKSTQRALKHFDDFYKGLYNHRWPSMRLALLSQPKHVALLNNFGDIEETEDMLQNEGAINLLDLLKKEQFSTPTNSNADSLKSVEVEKFIDKRVEAEDEGVISVLYPEGSAMELKRKFPAFDDSNELTESDQYDNNFIDPTIASKPMYESIGESQIDKNRMIDPSDGCNSHLLDDYVPATKLKGLEDYILGADYYRFYKVGLDFPINVELEHDVEFPQYLKVYSFPRGDVSIFPHPKRSVTGVHNYYCLDGASVLVVLALGLQPGDRVLDLCAAPGGKSLTMLQTLLPKYVVCNDSSLARINRMKNMFQQYLYDYDDNWKGMISITNRKAEDVENLIEYDKILVDVPCTVDRHSVTEDENNIFRSNRTKERLKLPEYQTSILEKALRLVRVGGTVVYSTCSLSPIQNDAVVSMAVQNVWKDSRMEFTVMDLTSVMKKMPFFRFSFDVRFGTLVVPFVPLNFGPMYFSKIVRIK